MNMLDLVCLGYVSNACILLRFCDMFFGKIRIKSNENREARMGTPRFLFSFNIQWNISYENTGQRALAPVLPPANHHEGDKRDDKERSQRQQKHVVTGADHTPCGTYRFCDLSLFGLGLFMRLFLTLCLFVLMRVGQGRDGTLAALVFVAIILSTAVFTATTRTTWSLRPPCT